MSFYITVRKNSKKKAEIINLTFAKHKFCNWRHILHGVALRNGTRKYRIQLPLRALNSGMEISNFKNGLVMHSLFLHIIFFMKLKRSTF